MDQAQVDAAIDALEASPERRADASSAVGGLLAALADAPATEVQRARLTLLGVDEVVRARSAADAALTIRGVRDLAVRRGHRPLEARAERALSVLFREIGDPSAAREHATAALALDGDDLDPVLRCRLPLAMADALHVNGSFDDARDRYREALERSRSLATPSVSFQVLNNWAYTSLAGGRVDAAADLADELQELVAQHDAPMLLVHTGTVAEVLHVRGRSAEAMALLRTSLEQDRSPAVLDVADCRLLLARIERETGDLAAAQRNLGAVDRLTTEHGFHALRVEVMAERARLLAARGDHAGAYALHRTFHARTLELRAEASETRTQTLHAIFAVDEARLESDRYREMSYRDPLTQLFNRRHVDEDLDRRLSQTASPAAAEPLAVAMVDLDHFKAVNDTFSHDAGDAVLTRIAELLRRAVATNADAYAARLGGEEFLLVLPHHDLARAHALAETLRHTIETHDWSDITPGLPITVSTGLAVAEHAAQPPPDRADLLRQADTHLYAAKHHGRNRVEPAITWPATRHARV